MKTPDSEPTQVAPRRRRRWLRVVVVVLGILMIAGTVAWQARLKIANHFLRDAVPDYQATVGEVDWVDGGLEMKNLVLRASETSDPLLLLERAHLEIHPLGNGSQRLGKLTLVSPQIQLGPDFWKQPSAVPNSGAASTSTAMGLQGIDLQKGTVKMELPTGEKITAEFDWKGGGLAMDADGAISAERQMLIIRETRADLSGEAAACADGEAKMEFSINPRDRTLTIHQLKSGPLTAHLTEAFLLAFNPSAPPEESAAGRSGRSAIEYVVVEKGELGPLEISLPQVPGWPQLPALKATLEGSLDQFKSSLTALPHQGTVKLQLKNFLWGNAGGSPWLELPSVEMMATAQADGRWKLEPFDLAGVPVNFSEAQIKSLGVPIPLATRGLLSIHCGGLVWRDGKIGDENEHSLELEQVHLQLGAESNHEVLQWERFLLAGKVNDITGHQHLGKLHLDAPNCQLTGADMKLFPATPDANEEAPLAPLRPPLWSGWKCDSVMIRDGKILVTEMGPEVPNVSANISASQVEDRVRFDFNQLQASTPGLPKAPPLLNAASLQVEIDPATFWGERRLEKVSLQGARVRIGAESQDAVTDVVEETPASLSNQPFLQPGGGEAFAFDTEMVLTPGGWHIGEVRFENTKVFLHHLVPDAPEIQIPLASKIFRNVPLTAEGWRQNEKVERVELPFVYVPGTRAGTSVADLDTNFIHFSLAGLMRKEIDFVELVNPKIYAGDSLFHYVDKIRAEAAEPVAPEPPKTLTEVRVLLGSLVSLLEGDAIMAPLEPTWKISRVRAVNGKIVTTIKDSPVLRVPPLPFGADSSLREGRIKAELAVPPGLYKPLLGMELVTAISEGNIVFNLPLKQKDNNLVQVFKADWLRYKQFRIANVVLQVTYDKNGIYAKFWAKAYQGDLEGAFNLYLDDTLSWDMWLAGTGIETLELTDALTPAYFSMGGKLDGKIIAQGDKTSLYQATGDFKNRQDGRIKIVALEDAIKALPEDWGEAQRVWTTKYLEVLRDFSYDKFTGQLRFYGLEGSINIRLSGPDGERNFDVFSHDRRLSEPEVTAP